MLSQIASYNTIAGVGVGHDEVGGAGDIISLDDGRFFFSSRATIRRRVTRLMATRGESTWSKSAQTFA